MRRLPRNTKRKVCLSLLFLLPTLALAERAKPPCLSHEAAKARWPEAHLYWRTERQCWTNNPHQREFSDPPPRSPRQIVANADPKSIPPKSIPIDVATPARPHPEIYFPEIIKGNMLEGYPLVIPQPWLSPESIISWPLLIDVDHMFSAWEKRIGQ